MLQGPGLITRGLGTPNTVTRGYGIFGQVVQAVTEAGRRVIRGGRSTLRKIEELIYQIVVAIRLISKDEVLGFKSKSDSLADGFPQIEGTTYIHVDPSKQIHVNVKNMQTGLVSKTPIEVKGESLHIDPEMKKLIVVTGKRIY